MVVFLQGVCSEVTRVKKTRQALKSFAGVGVTDRRREEAEAEGQHDDVQHEVLLVALVSARNYRVVSGNRIAVDQEGSKGQPGLYPYQSP
jgi:hypothetical protein